MYTFEIEDTGDPSVGIFPFSETIKLTVESGNISGDENEFIDYLAKALGEWYDAHVRLTKTEEVTTEEVTDANIGAGTQPSTS